MEASVTEWNAWMQGDAYFVSVGQDDETLESCGGYIGDKDFATGEGICTALHYWLASDVKERIEKHHLLERADEMNAYRIMRMHERGAISEEEKGAFLVYMRAKAGYDKASERVGELLNEKFKMRVENAATQAELTEIRKEMDLYPDCVEKTLMIRSLLMKGDGLKQ